MGQGVGGGLINPSGSGELGMCNSHELQSSVTCQPWGLGMSIQLGIWEGSNGGRFSACQGELFGVINLPPPNPGSILERYILSSEEDELHLLRLDLGEHKL